MTAERSAEAPAGNPEGPEGPAGPQDLPSDDLSRLAALHGVATSYQPSADRTVTASAAALTLALAALDVDASTPRAVAAARAARERELRERLLPPTVVCWTGTEPEALAALPSGTRLHIETEQDGTGRGGPEQDGTERGGTGRGGTEQGQAEQGENRTAVDRLPPGVHRLTATAPDGRTATSHLVVAPAPPPPPPPPP
jgi:4-alpha-glucanotransferase